jgi:5-methylcytosine-specific restriction endonuclease McrA
MGSCYSAPKEVEPIKKYTKKSIPKSLKKLCWDKWIGPQKGISQCLCCKHQNIRQIEFHCGHVVAEKSGGQTVVDNLRPICAQCNLSMGTMDMFEFQKKYFR